MDNFKSFIYTISSEERLNKEVEPIEYDLMFGGFGSQYNEFRVEILGLDFTRGFDNTVDKYLIVAIDDLASDGVFCQRLGGGNSVLFPITVFSDDSADYVTNSNIFFKVDNCRTARRIKMRILASDFEPVTAGANYHTSSSAFDTEWFLTMKVTPIID